MTEPRHATRHNSGARRPGDARQSSDARRTGGLPAERRSRKDFIAAAVIALVVVLIIAASWWGSDARKVEHSTDGVALQSPSAATTPPGQLKELWREESPQTTTPIVAGGGALTVDGDVLRMRDLSTGEVAWSYDRGFPLCDVTYSGKRIVAVYRGPKGCGDVVSLNAATGDYAHTRSALAEETATALRSNDSTGIISPHRVELWRSDLVRTTEVGHQEAPVQKQKQKYAECPFAAALTRKELLAVTQRCDGEDKMLLRLLKAEPEKADVPESIHSFSVPEDSQLVAIAQHRAAVYAPRGASGDGKPQLIVVSENGDVKHYPMPQAPALQGADQGAPTQPITADLPHNMTWWTGKDLVGFHPTTLAPEFTVPGALGAGADMADHLLVPVDGGVQVFDTKDKRKLRTIPVPREHHPAPVHARAAGEFVVEQRGDTLVVLGPGDASRD